MIATREAIVKRHIAFVLAFIFFAACGQQTLQLDRGQVFQNRFSDDQLSLAFDTGREIKLAKRASGQSRGIRAAYYGDSNNYQQQWLNPYQDWLDFGNGVSQWRQDTTRVMNVTFGNNSSSSDQCWSFAVQSNRRLRVLRYGPNGYMDTGGASSTSPDQYGGYYYPQGQITVSAQHIHGAKTLIFSMEDDASANCYYDSMSWWDYMFGSSFTNCGGQYQYSTLRISGSGGLCSNPSRGTINLDSLVNDQFNYGQWMQYFNYPVGKEGSYIKGRVLNYGYDNRRWDYDQWEYPDYSSCSYNTNQYSCTAQMSETNCFASTIDGGATPISRVSAYGYNECQAKRALEEKLCYRGIDPSRLKSQDIICYRNSVDPIVCQTTVPPVIASFDPFAYSIVGCVN